MPKWINCADRMPHSDKSRDLRVITWNGYEARENIWAWSRLMHGWGWERPLPPPTHWMPLPDPPPMPPTQHPE